MIQTAEQAIETIRALPKAEKEKFYDLLEVEKSINGNKDSKQNSEKFQWALRWIDEHREEYDGQFVLLEGDELIAYGTDAKALYVEARNRGINAPLVHRVKAKILPFGGW